MANQRICSIPECGKLHYAKDLCRAHWFRLRNHGDPLGGDTGRGDPQKFYDNVVLTYNGEDCLSWPFSTRSGYGSIRDENGKFFSVHRLVCKATNGEPPTPDHHAAHECGNRICVNPNHLSWKTPAGNAADKLRHGTHQRGERNGNAIITESIAHEILSLRGVEKQRDIAKRLGISQSTVSCIQRGERWSWLSERSS